MTSEKRARMMREYAAEAARVTALKGAKAAEALAAETARVTARRAAEALETARVLADLAEANARREKADAKAPVKLTSEQEALMQRQRTTPKLKVVDAAARLPGKVLPPASASPGQAARNAAVRAAIDAKAGVSPRNVTPFMHVTKVNGSWSLRQTRVHFSHG